MTSLKTPLCDLLGTELPIIQAPMAGGPTTPDLVAAVSNAGALGSFGFAYTQPEAMQRDIERTRALSQGPININLFASDDAPAIDRTNERAAADAVASYYAELGIKAPEGVKAPFAPDRRAQLDVVEDLAPRVFTFHLGDVPRERIQSMQSRGIKVGGSATCIAEAERLESLGVDFIIAQGAEAGGHRGTYLRDPYDAMTGTFALVRLIVRAVKLPVVAAGGIMDGAGIAAALALGAEGAQLGTAFVTCTESGAAAAYKKALLAAREDDTLITEKFSGKPARGLANRFIREMAARNAPQLPFPAQNQLTGPLRAAASRAGNTDFIALWAGQAVPLVRDITAADLVRQLRDETLEALDRLARLRS